MINEDCDNDPDKKVKLSIKYQVLCPETSLIGIVKLKEKSERELKKVEVKNIDKFILKK